ncbi:unnamed protein product [Lactuca virosa]|uniref:Ubiquitin-like protease family profile domain-containing protein n=1 Tax=Lactuca virosa TaxID=75947 RepID=A0AAU9N274_9ASTR|nr:unnamed protein product [Lactuca virosa]
MSPKKFYDFFKSLNKEQKKAVREMGLGSLLRIATNGISGKLARFVVNSFNPLDMKIHLPNAKIDITPELVHDLLRIPLGGKDIYNIDQCEGKELMDWKQQYNFKAMRPSDNKPGTCKTTVLPHLLGKTPMREIDWCGFITNCLKMSKMTWDETDRGNYYCGPLLVLLLAYLEFMKNDENEKRQIHALHFWDYEMMVKREKAELKSGDFGTLEWNDDVIENDEESDTDENEDMKLDELVFKAKKNYKKLVNDKLKFGKLIEFSTTKFTESDELKDMKKVFEQEFIYKTQNEDEEKSDENLNEHEIKNQPIMVTPGNLYNDPIVHEIADSIQCILNFDDYDDFENDGDESSEDQHMKKEIKNEKLDEGESYDSEETECDNNILGIEDDEDKKREVGKRLKKPSLKLSSPYNKKETKRGYVLGRGMIETMQAGLWVHAHVIDAWTDILNYKEKLKSNSTVNRYFFDTSMVVFFPVHQKNHFYIICINLEELAVDVIDNRNSVAKFPRAYRDAPNELVLDEGQSQINFNFGGC